MTRPLNLHRTPEWGRLKQAGFFKIDDQPGAITLSVAPTPVFVCIALAAVFGIGPLLLSPFLLPLSLAFGGLFVWGAYKNMRHGYKVRFGPDELTFYGPFGDRHGVLPREAMQQIAVKEIDEKRHGCVHEFIADMGWKRAFFVQGETKAAVQNNVLMAAFAQPVHLDLLEGLQPDSAALRAGDAFANLKPRQLGGA